jgi:hypothetical protein
MLNPNAPHNIGPGCAREQIAARRPEEATEGDVEEVREGKFLQNKYRHKTNEGQGLNGRKTVSVGMDGGRVDGTNVTYIAREEPLFAQDHLVRVQVYGQLRHGGVPCRLVLWEALPAVAVMSIRIDIHDKDGREGCTYAFERPST